MIFRDGELKVITIHYELLDRLGRLVQGENKAGILGITPEDAINQLKRLINPNAVLRINQLGASENIHVITENVVNLVVNKNKNTKTSNPEEKNRGGRPPGSKNKPKEVEEEEKGE